MRLFLYSLLKGNTHENSFPPLEDFAPNEVHPRFYNPALGKNVGTASHQEMADARMNAQMIASVTSKDFLPVKTHHQAGYHLGQPTVNLSVTAGAIYIVRHPLDVALSFSAFNKQSLEETVKDMKRGSRYILENPGAAYYYLGSWADHVESWTGTKSKGLHIVRYEDMVANPLDAFTKVIRFLRLRFDEERIVEAIKAVEFSKLQKREAEHGYIENPALERQYFRKGKVGGWQEELSPEMAKAITKGSEDVMNRFGYDIPAVTRPAG